MISFGLLVTIGSAVSAIALGLADADATSLWSTGNIIILQHVSAVVRGFAGPVARALISSHGQLGYAVFHMSAMTVCCMVYNLCFVPNVRRCFGAQKSPLNP